MDTKLAVSLQRAGELISDLRKEYDASLQAQAVSERAQQLTHEVFERLRSALDRLARRYWDLKISASLTEEDRAKAAVYFPVTNDEHEFDSALGRWKWKSVKQDHTAIYEWLLASQPFISAENRWLRTVNDLAVQGKHIDLVPQTRMEQKRVTVSRAGGVVSWNPDAVTFGGGGVSINGAPIDPRTQRIVPTAGVSEKVEVWISYIIEGYDINALSFCEDALARTTTLVQDMSNRFGL